jgi:hypothetical protein
MLHTSAPVGYSALVYEQQNGRKLTTNSKAKIIVDKVTIYF